MNIDELTEKCKLLEQENTELKEHLKRYTAPASSKNYYEKHKEQIKERRKTHNVTKPSPEKSKEYARKYYLKKKEEKQKEKELAAQNI